MERKLAAILSADVQGYSRLMGKDEEATIRTLTTYRDVLATSIHQHRGRVVDAPGDNLLAEFASAVAAVQCALEIQQELKARNAALPAERQMEFRLGLNVGDVVVEGDRIYGDGVNIAARLEGLAEGGGLCISGTVYDQIKNKLALEYEALGEQAVKNIAEPVRVWRVVMEPVAAVSPGEEASRESQVESPTVRNPQSAFRNQAVQARSTSWRRRWATWKTSPCAPCVCSRRSISSPRRIRGTVASCWPTTRSRRRSPATMTTSNGTKRRTLSKCSARGGASR